MALSRSAYWALWSEFFGALKTKQTQKKLLRSCIVVIVMLVFVVDIRRVGLIGQSGIFSGVLAAALPPFLPFSAHVYLMLVLLLGMLASWGWLSLAALVAQAARSQSLLAKQMQQAPPSVSSAIPLWVHRKKAASGLFLDPRSSAIYGVFLFISSLLVAFGLARRPELSIVLYFTLVFLDAIFVTYPLAPYPSYSAPSTFVIAAATYAAVSITSLIIIFPESYGHMWMCRAKQEILQPIISFLGSASDDQADFHLPDLENIARRYEQEAILFDLEFSVHRLSPTQFLCLQQCLNRFIHITTGLAKSKRQHHPASHAPNKHDMSVDELNYRTKPITDKLLMAYQVSLMDIEEWFTECNMDSWHDVFHKLDMRKVDYRRLRLEISRANLRETLRKHREEEIPGIAGALDPSSEKKSRAPINNVQTITLTLLDDLEAFGSSLFDLLSLLIDIENGDPKPKPRGPEILRRLFRRRSPPSTNMDDGSISNQEKGKRKTTETIAFRPERVIPAFHSFLSSLRSPGLSEGRFKSQKSIHVDTGRVIRWFRSPEAAFVLRFALLTVALWIPCVCKLTAPHFKRRGGLMALILGQTYLAMHFGEQLYFFLIRFGATLCGLLISTLAWHISIGKGRGNGYATVASTTILVLPAIFVMVSSYKWNRILFAMLVSTTVVSMVGFVWDQTHWRRPRHAHHFVDNVWQRTLMDIIGFLASVIFAMLPIPTTSRRTLHDQFVETMEKSLEVLEELYRQLLVGSEDGEVGRSLLPGLQRILDSHLSSERRLVYMKYEPRFRSSSHLEFYRAIFEAQTRFLQAFVLYLRNVERMTPLLRAELTEKGALCMAPEVLSQIFHFSNQLVASLSNTKQQSQPLESQLVFPQSLLCYIDIVPASGGNPVTSRQNKSGDGDIQSGEHFLILSTTTQHFKSFINSIYAVFMTIQGVPGYH